MSRAVGEQELPKKDPVASAFLEALQQALHRLQVSGEQVALLLLLLSAYSNCTVHTATVRFVPLTLPSPPTHPPVQQGHRPGSRSHSKSPVRSERLHRSRSPSGD